MDCFYLVIQVESGYYSFALSTFAPVKYGTFAQKMTHLPRDFWHICSKNGTFALVKKGTFAHKKQTIMYICIKGAGACVK